MLSPFPRWRIAFLLCSAMTLSVSVAISGDAAQAKFLAKDTLAVLSMDRLLPYLKLPNEATKGRLDHTKRSSWRRVVLPRRRSHRRTLNIPTHYELGPVANKEDLRFIGSNDLMEKFQYKNGPLCAYGLKNVQRESEKLGSTENSTLLATSLRDTAGSGKGRLPRQLDRGSSNRSPVKKLVYRKLNKMPRKIGMRNFVTLNETNLGRFRAKRSAHYGLLDDFDMYEDIGFRRHPRRTKKAQGKLTEKQEREFTKQAKLYLKKLDEISKKGHDNLERLLKEMTGTSKKRNSRSSMSMEEKEFEAALQRATDFCTELHTGDSKEGFARCIQRAIAVYPKAAYLHKMRTMESRRNDLADDDLLDSDYDIEAWAGPPPAAEGARPPMSSPPPPASSGSGLKSSTGQQKHFETLGSDGRRTWGDRKAERVAERMAERLMERTGLEAPRGTAAGSRVKGAPSSKRVADERSLLKYVQIKQALNNMQSLRRS